MSQQLGGSMEELYDERPSNGTNYINVVRNATASYSIERIQLNDTEDIIDDVIYEHRRLQ
jgi:hypothetical protein